MPDGITRGVVPGLVRELIRPLPRLPLSIFLTHMVRRLAYRRPEVFERLSHYSSIALMIDPIDLPIRFRLLFVGPRSRVDVLGDDDPTGTTRHFLRRLAMTRVNPIVIIVAVMLGLAGCAGGEDVFGKPGAGYVEDMAAQVAAADWSKAETITVTLSEFEFAPATLSFRQGVPYRLRMENRGDATHFFASEGFFKAIATQRLKTPQGEIDMPYLRSIVSTAE